jgi:hypothetical protein
MSRAATVPFLAVLGLLLGSPEVRAEDPNAFVECVVAGKRVFQRRYECQTQGEVTRPVGLPRKGGESDSWASISGDDGVTLQPMLGCKTPGQLEFVVGSAPDNRALLARVAAEQGHCTRLPARTRFTLLEREADLLRISTLELGRLWVSETERVPGLAELALSGPFTPEIGRPEAPEGLTESEREQVSAELAGRETVPGFAGRVRIGDGAAPSSRDDGFHMRTCRCVNGRRIRASRSCDEACGVHASLGNHGPNERDGGCDYRGEEMDCFEVGRRVSEDRARAAGAR